MTFEADILDDCELFDAVQTVTLTLLDGTTESVAYVTSSKLTKEQTRQYGPIGADDEIRNFSLPVQELDSEVPQQDCTITDADGVLWKIRSVEKRTVGTRYLCMCVKTRIQYVVPSLSVPDAQTTNEDTSKAITPFSIEDAKGYAQTVTLSVTNGALTLASTTGLTFTVGDGTADAAMTFSGSLANVNTAIATITYIPTANYSGSATLSIATNDGAGGTDSQTVAITVTAVNDAPVVTLSASTPHYTEGDSPVAVDSGLTISDVDDTNLESAAFVSLNHQIGQDVLAVGTPGGLTVTFSSNTGLLGLVGTASVAVYQTAMRSVTYNNTSGNPTTSDRTFRISVYDGTANSANVTKTVTVSANANLPPVFDMLDEFTITSGELNICLLVADDPEEGPVTFSVVSTSASLNGVELLISDSPDFVLYATDTGDAPAVGVHTITVRATDVGNEYTDLVITLTVTAP